MAIFSVLKQNQNDISKPGISLLARIVSNPFFVLAITFSFALVLYSFKWIAYPELSLNPRLALGGVVGVATLLGFCVPKYSVRSKSLLGNHFVFRLFYIATIINMVGVFYHIYKWRSSFLYDFLF